MNHILLQLYAVKSIRKKVVSLVQKLEKGEMHSTTLREIFKKYHHVDVGLFTYGGCFTTGAFDPNTVIGRYCSIAAGVRVMNRNHPVGEFSTHPFFFNSKTGYIAEDTIAYEAKSIGSDVWIGTNAMILPKVRRIGNGAIVGAGSIVVGDVPDFAVVAGNPAAIKKYRFSDAVIDYLKSIKWWEKDVKGLMNDKEEIITEVKKRTR